MRTTMVLLVVVMLGLTRPTAAQSIPLGAFNVDPAKVSVSGFSSGAIMAQQLAVAYSSRFMGVGVFAGWHYDCARNQPRDTCYGLNGAVPDIGPSQLNIATWSGNLIDPVANIAGQRIYVFGGTLDPIVGPNAVAQVPNLYRPYTSSANIRYDAAIPAGHAFPTDFDNPHSSEVPCGATGYRLAWQLTNCRFDGAGNSLKWIYGTLADRNTSAPFGTLVLIDQGAYLQGGSGMDDVAWLYVPSGCANGESCKLHVFLHACNSSYSQLAGEPAWPMYSGHRMWADTNNIVLLFPQVLPDGVNPGGCWHYIPDLASDFDHKSGAQMSSIMRMITKITSGYQPPASTAIEYFHAGFGHYFVTASQEEIAKLDAGVFAGWARTGESFNVYAANGQDRTPVCRFFTTAFPPSSSHFYALHGLGCEGTLQDSHWQFEGDVFYMKTPDAGGNCPLGTDPVFRLYNNGQGGAPNHRFTTSLGIRAQMLASGYLAEGAGIGVGMCAPV